MNNVSGGQRAENAIDGKVFGEDTSIYCMDDIWLQNKLEVNTPKGETKYQILMYGLITSNLNPNC